MLVLSRRPGQTIHIGDDVVVTVVRIGHNNMRIGVEAPQSTEIVRGELLVRDQQNVMPRRTGRESNEQ